jgi:hypothetical protein
MQQIQRFEEIPIHTAAPQPLDKIPLPEAVKARILRRVTLGVVDARKAPGPPVMLALASSSPHPSLSQPF